MLNTVNTLDKKRVIIYQERGSYWMRWKYKEKSIELGLIKDKDIEHWKKYIKGHTLEYLKGNKEVKV